MKSALGPFVIAIVLTLLLLMGRWTVEELGDSLQPGQMRNVGGDLFGIKGDPDRETAVTDTLELPSHALPHASTVLPELTRFPALPDSDPT